MFLQLKFYPENNPKTDTLKGLVLYNCIIWTNYSLCSIFWRVEKEKVRYRRSLISCKSPYLRDKNYPINYGRAKELAVGSQYRTYIIAPENITFPRWIRLGKWAAKIRVEIILIPDHVLQTKCGDYTCLHPLNPLDLPTDTRVLLYNRIVMPPVSLVSQAQLHGEYLATKKDEWQAFKATLNLQQNQQLPEEIHLPKVIFYGAGNVATTA